jgi:hypothetical protein
MPDPTANDPLGGCKPARKDGAHRRAQPIGTSRCSPSPIVLMKMPCGTRPSRRFFATKLLSRGKAMRLYNFHLLALHTRF